MKQTAVEWLVDQLKSTRKKYMGFKNIDIDYQEIIKQAKEMEKDQIINAFNYGQVDLGMEADEYYINYFKTK